ncbi:MAG: lipopolysaccharide heptosyltransferase II [Verrucomicrobiae bacterium]|nr:lipopolysaccharide heptosyltransferase II [Verrucomicrobiae bacterium]MDW7978965.1 lipopolysaccharide heptosyltransferase II [Verrucomicrobiales bacterium]
MTKLKLDPDATHRILIRSPNWVGDAVMCMPAVLRLREAFPKSYITVLARAKLAELWTHQPAVDEVIQFNSSDSPFAVARKLQSKRFDLAIVMPNSHRAAVEVWLARIPIRVGYARPWRNLFLTVAVPPRQEAYAVKKKSVHQIKRLAARAAAHAEPEPSTIAHQIHDYLHLVGVCGAQTELARPALHITDAEKEAFAKKFILRPGIGLTTTLNMAALAPGAEYGPAKRWPAERFIAAANEVSNRTGCQWLVFGLANDSHLAQQIAGAIPTAYNLCGRTTLSELMAGLALCRVLLANDSGAAHVAAAVGTPVVVPFGSTSPALTGPGLPGDSQHRFLKSGVACAPCFRRTCPIDHRCMESISVEQVVKAVLDVGFTR